MPTHPQQLEKAPHWIVGFLGSRTDRIRAFDMEYGHEKLQVVGRHAVALDDGNAYLAAGLAGLGVLWLPHYMAIAHRREGALRPLLTNWSMEPMPLYLAYLPNRHVGARIKVFIDWVTEVVTANAMEQR